MTDEEMKSMIANSIASLAAKTESSIAKASAEIAKLVAENVKLAAENAKVSAEIASLVAAGKETDKKIARVSEQMGGINENIGHHAEQFFQNVFADSKVFGGIKYDDIILNMMYKDKSDKVEFDIVLENGNAVALIEVKNRIHPDFVKELAEERIVKFRKYFPVYKSYDIYLGIAGFSFDNSVLEEAKTYGVGVIKQVGNGIEVDAASIKAYRAT